MSGRGETPESDEGSDAATVDVGQTLYTDEGRAVGVVRGIESGGVFVSTRSGAERLSVEHARSGHAFGGAELVWRCTNCGEMGRIDDGLPATCPTCGVPREELMYWTED